MPSLTVHFLVLVKLIKIYFGLKITFEIVG